MIVYKHQEAGPEGPKCRFEEPECSPADLCTFLCCLLASQRLFYLSFTSGSGLLVVVGRCCPTPLPKYTEVASRAQEDNAQTVGHTGVWEGWARSEHPPSYTDMESQSSTRLDVWRVIDATRRQQETEGD